MRSAALVVLLVACGDQKQAASKLDGAVGTDDSSIDSAIDPDASVDAMPPGPLAADPCAVYRADQDTDNLIELYLSCTDGATVTRTKINAPLIAAGDVQSTFRAAGPTISYIADGETDGVFEVFAARVDATTVSAAVKVNHVLGMSETVISQALAADGTKLVYMSSDGSIPGGSLYYVNLAGASPSTPQRIDLDTGTPVLAGGVYGMTFVGDSLVFSGAGVIQGGRREWFVVRFTGQTPGAPIMINPPYASFESAPMLIAPNEAWAVYGARQDSLELDAYLVDLRGAAPGSPTKLTPALVAGGEVSELQAVFTAQNDGVITFLADATQNDDVDAFALKLTGGVPGATTQLNPALPPNKDVVRSQIAPDGSRVLYLAQQDMPGHVELFAVDTSGATPSAPAKVNDATTVDFDAFTFATATKTLFRTTGAMTTGISSIYVKDLATAAAPVLVTASGLGTVVGTLLGVPQTGRAYINTRTTTTIDLEQVDLSQQPPVMTRINPTLGSGGGVNTVAASQDGKAIFYRSSMATGAPVELFRVDVSGAAPALPQKLTGTFVTNGQLFGYLAYSRPAP